MQRWRIVTISLVVLVVSLGTGVYLWLHATFVLPDPTCGAVGSWGAEYPLQPADARARQCFLAAALTCKAESIRVHAQGTESATDYVFSIRPGGAPGRCQVTEYSQDRFMGAGPVHVTGCREASANSQGVTVSCPKVPVPVLIGSGASQIPRPNPPSS